MVARVVVDKALKAALKKTRGFVVQRLLHKLL